MTDSVKFRQVLGSYPTGVCAITAVTDEGERAAMIVGTFSSVSLDPPLVGFFPDKRSSTWPLIQKAGRFCVNVLGSGQGELCRQLAASGADKFAGVSYRLSENGSPVLAGVLAWIDCALHDVVEAGDHYLALGRVLNMEVVRHEDPMLFFKGQYGGFATPV
jgi:3-hydroxy-9,10-secoandrosta-1,3,5(10)-triene-9,17-dione monooxygenase reductase component